MKVKCIGNTGAAIPKEYRDNFCSEGSAFAVDIGVTYNVYAMVSRVGSPIMQFLIADNLGYPRYCPSDLFEILETDLPQEFGYNEWKMNDFRFRVWGYRQILNYKHHEGIAELNPIDVEIFTRVRTEIDSRMWIDGEKEILRRLLSKNGLDGKIFPGSISSRDLANDTMTTYFNIPGERFLKVEIAGSPKLLNVLERAENIPGIASLLLDQGTVIGWVLSLISDTPNVTVNSLVITEG